jgi:hypothetical protein
MAQRPDDLDSVIETVLVDAYGDDEQYTAFPAVIGGDPATDHRGTARLAGHGHRFD